MSRGRSKRRSKESPENWKELSVLTTLWPRAEKVWHRVKVPGVLPGEYLDPTMARRAALVALGRDCDAFVWDLEHHYGYRLYKTTYRKMDRLLLL